ncbi:MAG: Mov34/MPN/PAD-1 family protein [Acidimicrobiales bacterium]
MLLIGKKVLDEVVCHCLDGYPLEACGLLAGTAGSDGNATVAFSHPTVNIAASARVYEVDPAGMLRAGRQAEAAGADVVGVYHSHTHTEAKPSATDVEQAPDPDWHYVVVSLRDQHPSVRSWRIRDGKIEEEPVVLQW